jgi:hypothetical protein
MINYPAPEESIKVLKLLLATLGVLLIGSNVFWFVLYSAKSVVPVPTLTPTLTPAPSATRTVTPLATPPVSPTVSPIVSPSS